MAELRVQPSTSFTKIFGTALLQSVTRRRLGLTSATLDAVDDDHGSVGDSKDQ